MGEQRGGGWSGGSGTVVLGGVWRRAYQGHREVGDTTAEVTPAGGGRVGDTDDGLGEHLGAPGLARHEGGEREADDATEEDEEGGRVDEHDANDRRGRAEEEEAETLAGAELVADPAHHEAEEDGAHDREGARETPLAVGHAQVGLDVRDERRRGEGRVEGREEAEPRGVEGAHVRVRRVAEGRQERILRGLVLGVDRDLVLAAEDVGRELGVLAHALKGGVELLELLLDNGDALIRHGG